VAGEVESVATTTKGDAARLLLGHPATHFILSRLPARGAL